MMDEVKTPKHSNPTSNHHEQPMLTALERELIGYVERLTQACENSAAQFTALEKRSTSMIATRQQELEDGVRSLIASQTSLVEALSSYVEESHDAAIAQRHLRASRQALMNAEEQSRSSLPK